MNYLKTTLVMTAALLMASAASAATYEFNLQNQNFDNPDKGDDGDLNLLGTSLTIVEGDLTGTFTGYYFDGAAYIGSTLSGGTVYAADSVERWYNGLGVCNVGECYEDPGDEFHTVDGATAGLTDFVEMAFTSDGSEVEVTLTQLVLAGSVKRIQERPALLRSFWM